MSWKKNNIIIHKKKYTTQSKRGFTLIEMIVAVSLFIVVVFVGVGALLAITGANRKANSMRTVMDNLNFAMESMSRNIRTGYGYKCNGNGNCPSGGYFLVFTDQNGKQVKYTYDNTNGNKRIIVDDASKGFSSAAITSPKVVIDSLVFYVTGVGPDGRQPRVVISIKGMAGLKDKLKTKFSIQTTISQRKVES